MNDTWTYKKHALITGASSGIGRELALNLVGNCRKLTLVARNPERLKVLEKDLRNNLSSYEDKNDRVPTEIDIYPMDICNIDGMKNLIKKIYETDKDQVDIFINCAGGSHVIRLFEEMNDTDIAQILDTNAKAPILLLRALLPRMQNNTIEPGDLKRGHILEMSSRSAERALPRLSVYAAAKAAVEKFIEAMQREYARHNLVFTLVAPGSINTSFTANWPQKDRDDHNAESMLVAEAVKPILQALNAQYATNRISFESTKQWQGELGVVKPEKERKNDKSVTI